MRRLAETVDWHDFGRLLLGLTWLACIAGIIWAWIWGVPRLEAYAAEQRWANEVQVQFHNAPAWMKGDLQLHLALVAQEEISGNPLNRERLVAARQALMETGWFNEIAQVRRLRDDLVEVQGAFVDPYAVIRDRAGDHLVDPYGKLLPRSYRHGAAPQFIAVSGVHFDRPSACGERWEGDDVTAALRLLRVVERQPWRDQVAAIDVAGYLRGQDICLMSTRGGRIIWGSAPGEEQSLENLADDKLRLLEEQYQRCGLIDGGFDELDLTLREGSFRR